MGSEFKQTEISSAFQYCRPHSSWSEIQPRMISIMYANVTEMLLNQLIDAGAYSFDLCGYMRERERELLIIWICLIE